MRSVLKNFMRKTDFLLTYDVLCQSFISHVNIFQYKYKKIMSYSHRVTMSLPILPPPSIDP